MDHELFKPRKKLKARRRLGLLPDRSMVLSAGSEEPGKDIPTLLRSFGKLIDDLPNALLVTVAERTVQRERLIGMFGSDGR